MLESVKPKSKPHPDFTEVARNVVEQVIGEHLDGTPLVTYELHKKDPAAVSRGILGGLKGGKARAKKLSAKTRSKIAKKAAKARWKK
jgi:hypothetical protein